MLAFLVVSSIGIALAGEPDVVPLPPHDEDENYLVPRDSKEAYCLLADQIGLARSRLTDLEFGRFVAEMAQPANEEGQAVKAELLKELGAEIPRISAELASLLEQQAALVAELKGKGALTSSLGGCDTLPPRKKRG